MAENAKEGIWHQDKWLSLDELVKLAEHVGWTEQKAMPEDKTRAFPGYLAISGEVKNVESLKDERVFIEVRKIFNKDEYSIFAHMKYRDKAIPISENIALILSVTPNANRIVGDLYTKAERTYIGDFNARRNQVLRTIRKYIMQP